MLYLLLVGSYPMATVMDKRSDYFMCEGQLKDEEPLPGTKDKLTTLVNVSCPGNKSYVYIVGLEKSKLLIKE